MVVLINNGWPEWEYLLRYKRLGPCEMEELGKEGWLLAGFSVKEVGGKLFFDYIFVRPIKKHPAEPGGELPEAVFARPKGFGAEG